MKILYLPFVLQGTVMFVDEFIFHEKRGLPQWERWGHPLDTLTVLAAFGYLLSAKVHLTVYVALSIFSCLFITKDEFVHAKNCSAFEHWLHSLLFILHPLSFLSGYFLFEGGSFVVLKLQLCMMLAFLFYQIFRWSRPWQTQVR